MRKCPNRYVQYKSSYYIINDVPIILRSYREYIMDYKLDNGLYYYVLYNFVILVHKIISDLRDKLFLCNITSTYRRLPTDCLWKKKIPADRLLKTRYRTTHFVYADIVKLHDLHTSSNSIELRSAFMILKPTEFKEDRSKQLIRQRRTFPLCN